MRLGRFITAAALFAAPVQATTPATAPGCGQVLEVEPLFAAVTSRPAEAHCWKVRTLHRAPPGGADATPDPAAGPQRRCTLVQTSQSHREQVGYRVKYRYRGRVYRTQAERHPGQCIRVQHDLRPIHF